ncbi:hypothetical protein WBG99_33230 [Streptomyces sp. TG1A-60]|uniref:hypothetical protein n=1 Tax=Streptomyces sp. TG1A-60 TaxID=3129111 RepID=UPI0030D451F1
MAGRGALSAGAIPALAYVGAPWWAVTLVALVLVAGAASVGLAERVFPQDSRDRRDWWLDLWQHRARRRTSR